MRDTRDLVIIGAGGHALDVLDCVTTINAEEQNAGRAAPWRVLGFADDNCGGSAVQETDLRVLCTPSKIAITCGAGTYVHIAVGDNKARRDLAQQVAAQGLAPATLISPRAQISGSSRLGAGTYVAHFAVAAPGVTTGQHVIVNLGAVIGHQAVLSDYAQASPNAVVAGGCTVDEGGYLGSNASLYPTLRLGRYALIASNSFAVSEVADGVTVMGVPARTVFKR